MNAVNTLVTIAEKGKNGPDPRFLVMAPNNGGLKEVTWEPRLREGDPKYAVSQVVPDFPCADHVRSVELSDIRVEELEAIAAACEEALSADRPSLREMITDPNVPPLPPSTTVLQMRNYFGAFLHRDANTSVLVKATAREWWAGASPDTAER